MKPIDVIRRAEGTKFQNEDDNIEELKLLPPLSLEELKILESRVIPVDILMHMPYALMYENYRKNQR